MYFALIQTELVHFMIFLPSLEKIFETPMIVSLDGIEAKADTELFFPQVLSCLSPVLKLSKNETCLGNCVPELNLIS